MEKTKVPINDETIRYSILRSLRGYSRKLFKEWGEVVICCDSRKNWRKEVFPYYKANRKKERANSKIDWEQAFASFETVKGELKEFFPYTVVDVDNAEADDVIATLIKLNPDEKTLILSGDTDFVQLHDKQRRIKQFSPVGKKFVFNANPTVYLKQHIIEGDKSDGIPNIASPDDCLVLGKRQGTLGTSRIKYLTDTCPSQYPSVFKRNFERNKTLIDLQCIPVKIETSIQEVWEARPKKTKAKLFNYFFDKNLREFIDTVQYF